MKIPFASLLEIYANFRSRGKCEKLIQYDARTLKFTGATAVSQLSDISITIGELSIDKKTLQKATQAALAADDFQYSMCNILSNPNLRKNLTPDRLAQHTENLIAAHACILQFRLAFEAFKEDPEGQQDNLNASIKTVQDFVQSVVDSIPTKPDAEQERKRAISIILSSIGLEDKDRAQLVAIVTRGSGRAWSRENIEDEIHQNNRRIHDRLMRIVTGRNLNLQLLRGDASSISEIVDMLINNGVIPAEGRSREFAQEITVMGNRVNRGQRITPDEFEKGNYSIAIEWFEAILPDIEKQLSG